jgi:2-polyprenyl-6-methoxyphenol hydroxylase-like FAD-dependent oxidoreductase
MSNPPRIAIVGGGISALTLGRILQLKGIPFTIFEREGSIPHRSQGILSTLKPPVANLLFAKRNFTMNSEPKCE